MRPVLVSACLLGERVRHDGGHRALDHPALQRWQAQGRVLAFCPECAGGLPVPRPPAELAGPAGAVLDGAASVRTASGEDLSAAFVRGAQAALALARARGVALAVLKEGSPSCGSHQVHDGGFAGRRIAGEGVTTALLRRAGLPVFGEHELDAAEALLQTLDAAAATMPDR